MISWGTLSPSDCKSGACGGLDSVVERRAYLWSPNQPRFLMDAFQFKFGALHCVMGNYPSASVKYLLHG